MPVTNEVALEVLPGWIRVGEQQWRTWRIDGVAGSVFLYGSPTLGEYGDPTVQLFVDGDWRWVWQAPPQMDASAVAEEAADYIRAMVQEADDGVHPRGTHRHNWVLIEGENERKGYSYRYAWCPECDQTRES